MDNEQTALRQKLLLLSVIFAFALPTAGAIIVYAFSPSSGASARWTVVFSYICMASGLFGDSLLYFAARRLRFRRSFPMALFPAASSAVMLLFSAWSNSRPGQDVVAVPITYSLAADLRMIALPFLILWLCGLWAKPLKNEALYAAVSIFGAYVLSSATNWLVHLLLPASPFGGSAETAFVLFGKAFWLDILVEAAGYALLWALFREKQAAREAAEG